jgi:hypothetical protein
MRAASHAIYGDGGISHPLNRVVRGCRSFVDTGCQTPLPSPMVGMERAVVSMMGSSENDSGLSGVICL